MFIYVVVIHWVWTTLVWLSWYSYLLNISWSQCTHFICIIYFSSLFPNIYVYERIYTTILLLSPLVLCVCACVRACVHACKCVCIWMLLYFRKHSQFSKNERSSALSVIFMELIKTGLPPQVSAHQPLLAGLTLDTDWQEKYHFTLYEYLCFTLLLFFTVPFMIVTHICPVVFMPRL